MRLVQLSLLATISLLLAGCNLEIPVDSHWVSPSSQNETFCRARVASVDRKADAFTVELFVATKKGELIGPQIHRFVRPKLTKGLVEYHYLSQKRMRPLDHDMTEMPSDHVLFERIRRYQSVELTYSYKEKDLSDLKISLKGTESQLDRLFEKSGSPHAFNRVLWNCELGRE